MFRLGAVWRLSGLLLAVLTVLLPVWQAEAVPLNNTLQPQYSHREYPHTIYAQHLVYSDKNREMYHFYYAEREFTLYMIMHGSRDGRTYTGVSAERAVEQLCVRNMEILGDKPLDKVVIVCCFPRYHAPTKFERLSIPIEFISNTDKPLMAEMYDDHFVWYEAK